MECCCRGSDQLARNLPNVLTVVTQRKWDGGGHLGKVDIGVLMNQYVAQPDEGSRAAASSVVMKSAFAMRSNPWR